MTPEQIPKSLPGQWHLFDPRQNLTTGDHLLQLHNDQEHREHLTLTRHPGQAFTITGPGGTEIRIARSRNYRDRPTIENGISHSVDKMNGPIAIHGELWPNRGGCSASYLDEVPRENG